MPSPRQQTRHWLRPFGLAPALVVAFAALSVASAQAQVYETSSPQVATQTGAPAAEVIPAPQAVVGQEQPALPQGPLALEDCIRMGLGNQPSVRAAQASLAAAHANLQALNNLLVPDFLRRDLPIRRRQACLGLRVAEGGLTKAEWETTYNISRNYFTMIYARMQAALLDEMLLKLKTYRDQTKKQVDAGNPDLRKDAVDTLDVVIGIYSAKKHEATNGVARARAAILEAMGLPVSCPLNLVEGELPPVTNHLTKDEVVQMALSRRGEVLQAVVGARIVHLEVCAQDKCHSLQFPTFAAGADIHSQPIPQGHANAEYRPWAIGIEMPTMMVGSRNDRVQRARELAVRAGAVADKTSNLVALEAANGYYRWKEAVDKASEMSDLPKKAAKLVETSKAAYDLAPKQENFDKLLRAQGLEAQAKGEYNQALYAHALALAALERITAGGYAPAYRRQAATVMPPANGKAK